MCTSIVAANGGGAGGADGGAAGCGVLVPWCAGFAGFGPCLGFVGVPVEGGLAVGSTVVVVGARAARAARYAEMATEDLREMNPELLGKASGSHIIEKDSEVRVTISGRLCRVAHQRGRRRGVKKNII